MHFNCAKQQDNLNTNKNKVSYSYVLPPLAEVKHRIFYFKEVLNMRIPYGFNLTTSGALEINEATAKVIKRVFDSYMTGASLGKIVENRSFPPQENQNGRAQPLIISSRTPNILSSLAWKCIWMYNLKRLSAAILITMRSIHLVNPADMFRSL